MKDKTLAIIGSTLTLVALILQIASLNSVITSGLFLAGLLLIITSTGKNLDNTITTFIILNILIMALVKTFEFVTSQALISNIVLIGLLTLNILLAVVSEKEKKIRILKVEKEDLFFASKTGNSFHERDCMTISNVPKEELIVFKSRNEALEKGYKPCRVCTS